MKLEASEPSQTTQKPKTRQIAEKDGYSLHD